MEEAAGVEGGGSAARVDGVGGVLAVGDRNGGVDEVSKDAAKPKEAVPRREEVRATTAANRSSRRRRRERRAARARFRRGKRAASGGNGGGELGEGLYRVGSERGRLEEEEIGAEDPAAINGAGEVSGEFPNESEGEREGKNGGKGRGNRGEYFLIQF
uniref:Pr1-like protein n=1 Tax=Oryza sativa subsp. japonica TaxID=39947 RepID=Q69TP9_ORYSJ|nr:pr1-like protein [Oryza sativa Japonica Group]BAD35778.1 pr1-like protein [Oryza sativa Japonica Group]